MLLINELTKLNDIDLKGLKFYERIFLDTLQTFLNIYFNSYYCMFHIFLVHLILEILINLLM